MSAADKILEVAPEEQDLDDVLLAMDVVDTLRHRERVVAHELDAEGRERELIQRLKEIYAAQGMDVPEHILKEGVKALEEDRFVYKPPRKSFSVQLAKLYVSRGKWMTPLIGGVAALSAIWGAYEFGVVRPAEARAEQNRLLMSQTLPAELDDALSDVKAVTNSSKALEVANAYHLSGLTATKQNDETGARAAIKQLELLARDVAVSYEVRVVYTGGRESGRARTSLADPSVTNYYLIVEAISPTGEVLTVPVRSEETGEIQRVTMWGQRVSKDVYDRVAADKMDDQIIQNSRIGMKSGGALEPNFSVETPGGAILEW